MTQNTYKLIEIVGTSSDSVTNAIDNAIAKASASVRHLAWFEVVETRGRIDGGKVAEYQVKLKVGFKLD